MASGESHAEAAVALAVRCGAFDDPLGKSEVAHLVEHLKLATSGRVSSDLIRAGVTASGSTEYDTTYIFLGGPAESLPEMIAAGTRMVYERADFTAAEVDEQKKRVWQELRQRHGDELGHSDADVIDAAIFAPGGGPYRPISGSYEELGALQPSDASAFATRCYAPENSILVVASAATPEQVFRYAFPTLRLHARRGSGGVRSAPRGREAIESGHRRVTWKSIEFATVLAVFSPERTPRSWFLDSILAGALSQAVAAEPPPAGTSLPRCAHTLRRGYSAIFCAARSDDQRYVKRTIDIAEAELTRLATQVAERDFVALARKLGVDRIALRSNPAELAEECVREAVAVGGAPEWCIGRPWPPDVPGTMWEDVAARLGTARRVVVEIRPSEEKHQ